MTADHAIPGDLFAPQGKREEQSQVALLLSQVKALNERMQAMETTKTIAANAGDEDGDAERAVAALMRPPYSRYEDESRNCVRKHGALAVLAAMDIMKRREEESGWVAGEPNSYLDGVLSKQPKKLRKGASPHPDTINRPLAVRYADMCMDSKIGRERAQRAMVSAALAHVMVAGPADKLEDAERAWRLLDEQGADEVAAWFGELFPSIGEPVAEAKDEVPF